LYTQPWGNHSVKGTLYSIEYFTNGNNYTFEEGKLKLVARAEKYFAKAVTYQDSAILLQDGGPNLRWWDYTSGMIYSKKPFGQGKYEMRVKIPKGKSFWSACMLFGKENHEVDVFEFWNENNVFGKYKESKLSTECHMSTHANGKSCSMHATSDDFSTDFHTYTFIWNNTKMEWFIDGKKERESYKLYKDFKRPVECEDVKLSMTYKVDRTYPMHDLHISVGLSLQAGKNAPDKKTVFPAELEIDYIRYWRYAD
jgi:beta-glucanase (GH16 family)